EARERDDALPGGEDAVGAGTEALDRARDLVADHARARRRVGVEAEARHHVGEVDAGGAHADERLAGAGDRVRAVADLERLGRPGAGLVLVDTGSAPFAGQLHAAIRRWNGRPLHTAILSHGHIDHVFGLPPFEEEARGQRWPAPRVVAHEGVPARFDRYRLTAGYNRTINARQFRIPGLVWPTDYRYPDATYRDALDLEVGGVRFALRHGRGETDDHTWTWVPERRVLCTGDFFIWASPNAGN